MVQGEFAPIQAFRIAGNLVGVEFHPEIDLRTVRHLNQIGAHRLDDFGVQSARDQITTHRRYAQQNTTRLRAALVRWLAH
jgi:GMP synthase-like glutamine amidotransferase